MKKYLSNKLILILTILAVLGFMVVSNCNSAKLRMNPTTGDFEWAGDNDVIKVNPTTGKFEYVDPDAEIRPNPTTGEFEWVNPD